MSSVAKQISRLLLLVMLSMLAFACTGQGATSTPTPVPEPTATPTGRGQGDTLRLVYYDAPETLNPHLSGGVKDYEVSRLVYEPLASFDRDTQLIPILAAEIPSRENGGVAADGTAVTWRLKTGVRWSDGTAFTAEDVKFTYDYITNPDVKATFVGSYAGVRSVEVIDPYTVQVNFTTPTPFWAVPFVGKPGLILPRHIFASFNGPNAYEAPANLQPVGTGPYQIVGNIKPQEVLFLGTSLVKTNKIIFEPNPYFREPDKPYFSRVEVRGGGTVEQAFRNVLEEGTTDYAWNIKIEKDQQRELEALGYGRVLSNPTANIFFLVLNHSDPTRDSVQPNPVLDDLRVRQAIAHAVDRERIVREVYGSAGEVESNYVVAPEDYRSQSNPYPFDLERAAELLSEAGWVDENDDGVREKDGRSLQLTFQVPVGANAQDIQPIIQQDLEKLGFKITVNLKDPNVYFSSGKNPESYIRFRGDLSNFVWTNDSPDPAPSLTYWVCDGIPTNANEWSGFNISRWCQPQFDRLLDQLRDELDEQQRRQQIIALNDLMIKEVPFVVIARTAQLSAVSNSLEGVDLTPWDAETWNIKDWRRATTP